MIHPSQLEQTNRPFLKATLVQTIDSKTEGYSSLHISQTHLLLVCSNSKVKIHSLYTYQEEHVITAYSTKVTAMFVVKDILFSGQEGQEGIIKVWDIKNVSLLRVLKGHHSTIKMITALNEKQVFSASSDGTVRAWDITNSDEVVYRLDHKYPVLVVQCVNNDLLVSGGDDCLLIVWQWAKQIKLKTIFSHSCSITCLVKMGDQMVSAGGDGMIRFWNVDQLTEYNSQNSLQEFQKTKSGIKVSQNSLQHCCLFQKGVLIIDDENNIFYVKQLQSQRIEIDIPYNEITMGVACHKDSVVVITDSNDARIFKLEETRVTPNLSLENTFEHIINI